jgi:hypothetical protein
MKLGENISSVFLSAPIGLRCPKLKREQAKVTFRPKNPT